MNQRQRFPVLVFITIMLNNIITTITTAAFTCIAWHATLWSRAESAAQKGDEGDGGDAAAANGS